VPAHVPTAVIAHRGASVAARENTLDAFRLAVQMGADAVELDVRRTSDDRLVVHHDAFLASGHPIVCIDRRDLPGHVPDLLEALEACAGAWVNVEIKNDPAEPDFDPARRLSDRVVDLLDGVGTPDRWLISSFDLASIERVRDRSDSLRTAWLVSTVPPDVVAVLVDGGHHALHPWVCTLEREVVDRCHAAGLAVNTWTCDDPVRIRELADWGVDGICTNVPDIARRIVDEREGA
jgi:glycerophosphoryl diester phosphodiesterase